MMTIYISLFGKLNARYGEQGPIGLEAGKAQELFCYLLLHRDRPQAREILASQLWGNYCTTPQSRKYLRNSLWQLQSTLNRYQDVVGSGLLLVEPDWIQLQTIPALWLDVAVFEEAYTAVRGKPGREVTRENAEALVRAADLYRGHLLEGWPMEWCLYERERLVHMYITILDKLIDYCEGKALFEEGLSYGERILQIDRAREQTHGQMMRLYLLAGDRTGALRQFERCAEALKAELAVTPTGDIVHLYQNIRQNNLIDMAVPPATTASLTPSPQDIVRSLQRLQASLEETRIQLQQVVRTAELVFGVRFDSESRRS